MNTQIHLLISFQIQDNSITNKATTAARDEETNDNQQIKDKGMEQGNKRPRLFSRNREEEIN